MSELSERYDILSRNQKTLTMSEMLELGAIESVSYSKAVLRANPYRELATKAEKKAWIEGVDKIFDRKLSRSELSCSLRNNFGFVRPLTEPIEGGEFQLAGNDECVECGVKLEPSFGGFLGHP